MYVYTCSLLNMHSALLLACKLIYSGLYRQREVISGHDIFCWYVLGLACSGSS